MSNKLKYAPGTKEIFCIKDKLTFQVRNGVPILLESDARQADNCFEETAKIQEHSPTVELVE